MVEPLVIVPDDVDGTRIIRVTGEIDIATAPQLLVVLATNDSPLCVDLAGVTFIDSSGIAVFVQAHERAAQRGRELRVTNAAPHVLKVFEIANLDHILTLEPT